ncbi:MAG: hypothetical protein M3Z20_16870 [Chloroflexota bacterium]|nr:hypothetical protein [Chloroflexota bacterium]
MTEATARALAIARCTPVRTAMVARVMAVLLAIAVLFLLLASILWISWHNLAVVPISDEWEMGRLLEKFDAGTLRTDDLWAVHNEHRILFSRLISLPVIVLLDWNRFAHLVVVLVIVVASMALLLRAAWQSIPWRAAVFTVLAPVVALSLSLTRLENWTLPFTDKIPTVFGIALCVWALAARKWSWPRVAWAILGAVIASASSLGGLIIWVAFAPTLLVVGKRAITAWGLAAAVTAVIYFHDYAPAAHSGAVSPGERPGLLDSMHFMFAYIGAPIGYPHLERSTAFGVVGCVLLLIVALPLLRAAWRDPALRRDTLVWLGLAAFAGMSGVAILAGRSWEYGAGAAQYSRFHAFASLWWIAALVLTGMAASYSPLAKHANLTLRTSMVPEKVVVTSVALLVCAGIGLAVANYSSFVILGAFMRDFQSRQGCVFLADTAPEECLAYFWPDVDEVRSRVAYLYDHQRGFAAGTMVVPGYSIPSAPAYFQVPAGEQARFRCGGLEKGGRAPIADISPAVMRTVCERTMNAPWPKRGEVFWLLPSNPFCVVPNWDVSGFWVALVDGSEWCAIDWKMDDGRAATLVNQDGSVAVHAYFPSGSYTLFVDGQPVRRTKS